MLLVDGTIGKFFQLQDVKLRLSEEFSYKKTIVIQVQLLIHGKNERNRKVFKQQVFQWKNILWFTKLGYCLGGRKQADRILLINVLQAQGQWYQRVGYVKVQASQFGSHQIQKVICSQKNPNQDIGFAYVCFDSKGEQSAGFVPYSFLSFSHLQFARLGRLKDDEAFILSIYTQDETKFICDLIFIDMKSEKQKLTVYIPNVKKFHVLHFKVIKAKQVITVNNKIHFDKFEAKGSIFIDSLQQESQVPYKLIVNCCQTDKQFCSIKFQYRLSFNKEAAEFPACYDMIAQIGKILGTKSSFWAIQKENGVKIETVQKKQSEDKIKSQKRASQRGSSRGSSRGSQRGSQRGNQKRGSQNINRNSVKLNSSAASFYCQKKNKRMSKDVKRLKDMLFNTHSTTAESSFRITAQTMNEIQKLVVKEFFVQNSGEFQRRKDRKDRKDRKQTSIQKMNSYQGPDEIFEQNFYDTCQYIDEVDEVSESSKRDSLKRLIQSKSGNR